MVDEFVAFARVCFETFGDKVKAVIYSLMKK